MSNSTSDDYFSFMARKGRNAPAASPTDGTAKRPAKAASPAPVAASDVVDFVDDSEIEVSESFVSDTTIQRMFKRCGNG